MVRERAAEYTREGRELPEEFMVAYKKTTSLPAHLGQKKRPAAGPRSQKRNAQEQSQRREDELGLERTVDGGSASTCQFAPSPLGPSLFGDCNAATGRPGAAAAQVTPKVVCSVGGSFRRGSAL